jgi:hypothetical protein
MARVGRLVFGFVALLAWAANAADPKPIRFWNLTTSTVVDFRAAPTGTVDWGPNQCANDRDGAVDHDERLRITGITPGRYDVKLTFKDGRACTVRNIEIKDGAVFSIDDKDLTECHKP